MEKKVRFLCDEIELSGLFEPGTGDVGVVVTHPHPVYGGDMYNPVVEAIVRAYRQRGYATLRFNFRGTGESTGAYDGGDGEQEDVSAALFFLSENGIRQVDLAGYSFGAWVCARGLENFGAVHRLMLVSPPVAFLDFDEVAALGSLKLVVTGSEDELAPPDLIEKRLPAWNEEAQFRLIEGADHFFFGFEKELAEALRPFL